MNTIAKLREDMAMIQAAIEGKSIEWRDHMGEWCLFSSGKFNFAQYEYRIAPDVVYKIEEGRGRTYYRDDEPKWPENPNAVVTKGYFVEGDPA